MKKSENFLEYLPMRNCEWAIDEKGRVYLIKERAKSRWLKKMVSATGRSPNFHIHLDELGSGSWQLADGKRTIGEICREMETTFGDRVKPALERVSRFFAIMYRNGFVKWDKPNRETPE